MNIAIIAILFLATVLWQLPSIWKEGQKKEIILYICLISIDIVLSISLALHVDLPIISDGVIYFFKPLKDMVYGSLE
ncbi:hypothetical protein [Shimazuella alba]|uniref:Uncharacterized protein n=1 Tax=Shimazuella alba TaxID=2690964 RepID=A0A6I4VR75_9BACL|nr:hypothetical protein [Shimazuella alba]MXQ52908.1 hypothetical protein [Shimazuella alba]